MRRTKGGPSGPSGPSQTAAQRRANGRELLRAWLDADTWAALEELTAVHESRTAAVSAAILGWC